MSTSVSTSVSQFDALIERRSVLHHYFYEQKWNNGELTEDDMKIYAKEYYSLVKAVPGIVSRVKERALERRPDMIDFIDENLEEEKEHIELWERFGRSLGISKEELQAHVPTEKTKVAIARMHTLAEQSFEDGVMCMYSMEKEIPKIAETKKDGLCKFYGLTSEDAHIYFDEHLGEEKHFKVWQQVDIEPEKAEKAANESLDCQNLVLDAVCDLCDFDMDC